MSDPITIALIAGASHVSKDAIKRLFGPTADYLGEGMRDLVKRRMNNVGSMVGNAIRKMGDRLNEEGQIPPRVLRTIIEEGSYNEDSIVLEYLGGILASARTKTGRDDRGASLAKIVNSLSTYQIRTHYLIYATLSRVFANSSVDLGTSKDRHQLKLYLPLTEYNAAMEFSIAEIKNPQISKHVWFGLSSTALIEMGWATGPPDFLQEQYNRIFPVAGTIVTPSPLGIELFLWAFGYSNKSYGYMLSDELKIDTNTLPDLISNAVAVSSLPSVSD